MSESGFLTAEKIKKLATESDLIRDHDLSCFDSVMYDLRLGRENYVTPKGKMILKDESDFITIQPGQTAILTTFEYLNMPSDIFGMITIRFKLKGKGLINISGFHVDPLFEGHLVFSVFNAGKRAITLSYKQPIFSIFMYQLDNKVKTKQRKITNIPTDIIEHFEGAYFPSLLEMEKEMTQIKTYIYYLGAIGLTILGILLAKLFDFI